MKAVKQVLGLLWLAFFVGCQEEQFNEHVTSDNYYASVESFDTSTKTSLGENNSVIWSTEDCIAVFDGVDEGKAYQILDSYVGKTSGEFTLKENLNTEGSNATFDDIVAIYPFNESLSVTANEDGAYEVFGIEFPSEQIYVKNSFTDEAFPMVALENKGDRKLQFRNVGGVLKLSLKGDFSVSKISFTGNSGEILSGSATVAISNNGSPSVKMSEDASTSVTLVCEPAVQLNLENATDFYISVPSTVFEAGFKATVFENEGKEYGVTTYKNHSVKMSSVLAMPEITPESLDDVVMTADTFCSVDFIKGWSETRFGGDGTIVFIKEDEQGRMTNSLMFLPDEENILMPVYVRYDENEIPSYLAFMDTEVYIDGYTDNTIDFTLAVEDAVWSIKDVPCDGLMPYSLQTRAWTDNNAIRNVCAIGNLIVGVAGVAGGVVLVSTSGIGAAITGGTSIPVSAPGIALGVMNIIGGCESIDGSMETIFGPVEQTHSTYVMDGIMGIAMEKLSDAIEKAPKNEFIKSVLPPSILQDTAGLGKVGTISYWSGFLFSSIDEEWGKTYTGPANLAQVHQEVNIVTGRADNVTEDSAELYGYVSPVATEPFGERILTEIYIALWKASDKSSIIHQSVFNSGGGTVSFTFTNLEPQTEYCYQTIFEDCYNKKYRFGEVKTFKTDFASPNILIEYIDVLYALDDGERVLCGLELGVDLSSCEDYSIDKSLGLMVNKEWRKGNVQIDFRSNVVRVDSVYLRRSAWDCKNGVYVADFDIDICDITGNQVFTSEPYNVRIRLKPCPVNLKILLEEIEIRSYNEEKEYYQQFFIFCNTGLPDDTRGKLDVLQVESVYCYGVRYYHDGTISSDKGSCFYGKECPISGFISGSFLICDSSILKDEKIIVVNLKDGTILSKTVSLGPIE